MRRSKPYIDGHRLTREEFVLLSLWEQDAYVDRLAELDMQADMLRRLEPLRTVKPTKANWQQEGF